MMTAAATANMPLAKPRKNTVLRIGQGGPPIPAAARVARARAEPLHPSKVQARIDTRLRPMRVLPTRATQSIPSSTPPC